MRASRIVLTALLAAGLPLWAQNDNGHGNPHGAPPGQMKPHGNPHGAPPGQMKPHGNPHGGAPGQMKPHGNPHDQ